jgi:hypothetical protein
MWGVGWDINGLAGAHDQFFVPKGEFDLAFEEGKGFLKIVAMGSRAAPGWNEHVDQAITAIGIIAGQQNSVGISSQPDVRQALPRDSSSDWFPVLKQYRNPERGRPSGIEGARRLRVDAKYVALFS